MIQFMSEEGLMGGGVPQLLWLDQEKKLVAYKKKNYIFIFNFHPANSYAGFELPIHETTSFRVALDTDEERFGGQNRISHSTIFEAGVVSAFPDFSGIVIYSPSRTAMVLKKVTGKNETQKAPLNVVAVSGMNDRKLR